MTLTYMFATFAIAFGLAAAVLNYLGARSERALETELPPERRQIIESNKRKQSNSRLLALIASVLGAIAFILAQR